MATGRKTYRTAAGKHIDMEAMLLHNEDSIAVGNNPVNARGDEIGPGGEVLRTNAELVQEYYAANPNAVEKSQPVASISEDMIPESEKQPATVSPAMSVEEQPAPEVSSTPKKTPKATATEAQAISADPTVTADEATQTALEKKIATAKKKAADKAQKAKEEAEAKLPKAVTGALDNLDLG